MFSIKYLENHKKWLRIKSAYYIIVRKRRIKNIYEL